MRARPIVVLTVALTSLVLVVSPVSAALAQVTIRSISYAPSSVVMPGQGSTVRWTNVTSPNRLHDVISSLPGYFQSGLVGNGETFSVRFPAAGTFTYICSLHDVMLGSVAVPLRGELVDTGAAREIRLQLGASALPPDSRFRYVIAMQAPGDTSPRVIRVGRGASAVVVPAAPGTYRFVARLKDTVTKRPSADSPDLVLDVVP